MSKYFQVIILLFVISVGVNAQEQEMWHYIFSPYDSDLWKDDRSNNLAVLKSIIENNSVDIDVVEYEVAVEYLYRHHKETETQFLLENLNTKIDATSSESKLDQQWDKFYIDKYHLGLLGDLSAIEGMDSVARYSTSESLKLYAISNLSEIDIFDHYEYVKREYLERADGYNISIRYLNEFANYGRSERYRDEVRDIIFNKISTIDKNQQMKVYYYASALSRFDKEAELNFYNDCFYEADSTDARHNYFIHLKKLDKDGQPKRTMYVLPIEKDIYTAAWEYIQNPKYAQTGVISRRYLMPYFINFMSNIQFENIVDAENRRISFLKAYRPFKPDSSIITEALMFDTLTSYTNQSYGYEWLKDETYKTELLTKLTNAKTKLTAGDSLGCRTEVATFQNSVTQVYQDSAVSYPKYVSNAGYKFMYHYAQYILDRLPEAPTVEGLPVKLQDSQGNLLQNGTLQYYDSGWQDAIDNGKGTFTVQTERTTVSLKMLYAGGSQQINNVTVGQDTAVFQTVNATVQLLNSQNTLIDSGAVKYFASGWKDLGTTLNGVATKELLPRQYTFRMEFGGANQDLAQGIDTNATVVFQTTNAEVQLKDSQGNSLDGGVVKYYASGWKDFGVAINGTTSKELLPRQYTFRMEYGGANQDLAQGIDTNATVVFQTTNAEVQLKDSQGNSLDGGVVKYYASGWKDFGTATNGTTSKELLPRQYTFRMEYGGANQDLAQGIDTNATVVFQTVNAKVQVKDSQGNLLDGGVVKYYASGWKDFGTTQSGVTNKELLGRTYTFRMTHEKVSNDKSQDVSVNNAVIFSTVLTTVQVKDAQNQPIENAEVLYYGGGWHQIGFTSLSGEVTKELLARSITFKAKQGTTQKNKQQDTSINNIVEIILE